ncbi:MAG: FHA domain-containing protein [Myxococcales bacterium]|nr:FHA domain-containing protein [Myxococcales bacterium]
MWSIDLRDKSGAVRRLSFARDEIIAGRVEGSDVVLQSGNISKRHTRFERVGDDYFVTDLGSTNGTWVDGRRIKERTLVARDSVVIIGDFSLTIVRPEGAVAAESSAYRTIANLAKSTDAPDARADEWCITWTDKRGFRRVQSQSTHATIGSSTECEVAVEHGSVLDRHASLELREGLLFLWPTTQAARVTLSGRPVVVPTSWRTGESATVGEVTLERVATSKPPQR